MIPHLSDLFYPAEIATIMVEGAKEILGPGMFQAIVSEECLSSLIDANKQCSGIPGHVFDVFQNELYNKLGLAGGQGIALRIGRASFRYGLKHFGESTGLSSVEFRLMPTSRRICAGLGQMANLINGQGARVVEIEQQPGKWIWRQVVQRNVETQAPSQPACYLMVGFLQGFLGWASGGRFYPLTLEMQYAGDAVFQVVHIDQRPLE
jgi:hypothetical protein